MKSNSFKKIIIASTVVAFSSLALIASATHSWGGYHWARTSNPFTLKLSDNVSSTWDPYLITTSADWSLSSVLDTAIVTGGKANGNCRPTSGRVEVCSKSYGFNGWLGVAQIWISGNHITQGAVKVNDSYFNTSTYNKPSWRQFVMCQEVGHTFGLDHQDENFSNVNLGTCMDYTNDPDGILYGQLSNLHPNAHDYEELETIYQHFDSTTTVRQNTLSKGNANNQEDVITEVNKNTKGKTTKYELDLGKGEKLVTFIIWSE